MQKRVLHLIHCTSYTAHTVSLFIQSNIIPVKLLYFKTVPAMMHDASNNFTPPNISQPCLSVQIPCTITPPDFHLKTISISSIREQITQKNSFSKIGAKIWNSIPPDIRVLSKHSFKVKLHETLLTVLALVDTYVDTPFLISKLSQYS